MPVLGTANQLEPLLLKEIVVSSADEAQLEIISESEVGGIYVVKCIFLSKKYLNKISSCCKMTVLGAYNVLIFVVYLFTGHARHPGCFGHQSDHQRLNFSWQLVGYSTPVMALSC